MKLGLFCDLDINELQPQKLIFERSCSKANDPNKRVCWTVQWMYQNDFHLLIPVQLPKYKPQNQQQLIQVNMCCFGEINVLCGIFLDWYNPSSMNIQHGTTMAVQQHTYHYRQKYIQEAWWTYGTCIYVILLHAFYSHQVLFWWKEGSCFNFIHRRESWGFKLPARASLWWVGVS